MNPFSSLLSLVQSFIIEHQSAAVLREERNLLKTQISVLQAKLADCMVTVRNLDSENQNLKQKNQVLEKKVEELSRANDLHPSGVSSVEPPPPSWKTIREQLKK